MKKSTMILSLLVSGILFSCNNPASTNKQGEETKAQAPEKTVEKSAPVDTAKMIAPINQQRQVIEEEIVSITPVVIKTDKMREKIKQKWSSIDYYVIDGQVVRLKTYPHPEISKRTEEFYFENGQLILAVVEDNGEGERGKGAEEIDKMFYYVDGQFFFELKRNMKVKIDEFSEIDAKELQKEAQEYMEIYQENK